MFSVILRSARSLRFYSIILLLLGGGIGACTAIFGVYDLLLLRALPVNRPDQLVILTKQSVNGNLDDSFSYPIYRDLKKEVDGFEALVGFDSAPASIEIAGSAERGVRELVTGEYFAVLGLAPHLGRLIQPSDDVLPGAHPVAVLSHSCWQSRFGSNPGVVGQTVRVNGFPLTIIGVAAEGFHGLKAGQMASIIVPMSMQAELNPTFRALQRRSTSWMKVFGRLKSGADSRSVQAQISSVFQNIVRNDIKGVQLPAEVLTEILGERISLASGHRGYAAYGDSIAKPLTVLLAGAVLLLFALCGSIAGLFLARSDERAKEMAMRAALGAARGRLVGETFAEATVIGLIGTGLGLLLAVPMQGALVAYVVAGPARELVRPTGIDLRLASFAVFVSLCAVIAFSVAPAWKAARIDPMDGLRAAISHRSAAGRWAGLVDPRGMLIGGQVALATLLLLMAALFVQSARNLRDQQRLGFRPDGIVMLALEPSDQGYKGERAAALYASILEGINAAPGIDRAAVAFTSVLSADARRSTIEFAGTLTKELSANERTVVVNPVSPGYFGVMRMAVRGGADFSPAHRLGRPLVAIVSEAFAKRFFGGEALGRRFRWSGGGTGAEVEIVGVVSDILQQSPRAALPLIVYVPIAQEPVSDATIYVRSRLSTGAVAGLVRAAIRVADPALALFDVRTLDEQVNRALLQERLIGSSATAFGAASLLLAVVGLYGVVSQSVSRRTREFGIRLALGSSRLGVIRNVLAQAIAPVILGAAVGCGSAIAASGIVEGFMFGVRSSDPLLMAAVCLVVCIGAVASVLSPVRSALRTDPAIALRHY